MTAAAGFFVSNPRELNADARAGSRPLGYVSAVLALLLVIGLYFPTSRNTVVLKEFQFLFSGVLLVLLVALLARRNGVLGGMSVPIVAAMNGVILLATLFSPFTEFAYGASVPFLLASALLCLHIRDLRFTVLHRSLFTVVHIVNIVAGVLIVRQEPAISELLTAHYSNAWDELVYYMVAQGKPVLMFYSHSVAGFYLYLFSWLTFRTYTATGSRLNLCFALLYLFLLTQLYSVTSYLLFALALVQIVWFAFSSFRRMTGFALAGFLVSVLGAQFVFVNETSELTDRFYSTFESEGNGFLGRYSRTGGHAPNLAFIAANPFSPVGLGFSHTLIYGDSGIVTSMTRGSVPFVLALYGGLYLFFLKNLRSRRDAIFLFLLYMGFETGYGSLEYLRGQYLLPLVVVYVNSLPDPRSEPRRDLLP